MALVVPIRQDLVAQRQSAQNGPMNAQAPPDENFLLMSAALMHRDGRLIKTAMNTSDMPESRNIEDRRGEPKEPFLEHHEVMPKYQSKSKPGPVDEGEGQ